MCVYVWDKKTDTVFTYFSDCVSIVLEELSGGTLSGVLERRGREVLPRGRALEIARQLISALEYIHEDLSPYAMIIHRGFYYLPSCLHIHTY